MNVTKYEMNYCRRCGLPLENAGNHVYKCQNKHTIYHNPSPAVTLILTNSKGEIATLVRAIEPGIGKLDFPGGFCDGDESVITAIHREVEEEIGLKPSQYSDIEFLHSEIDDYIYENEVNAVVSVVFKATTLEDVILIADDDAKSAEFLSVEEINEEDIYFPSARTAFKKMSEILAKHKSGYDESMHHETALTAEKANRL